MEAFPPVAEGVNEVTADLPLVAQGADLGNLLPKSRNRESHEDHRSRRCPQDHAHRTASRRGLVGPELATFPVGAIRSDDHPETAEHMTPAFPPPSRIVKDNLLRSSNRRSACSGWYADLIEVYDEAGESQGILRGPLGFESRFTVVRELEGDVASSGQDLRFGYVDLALTPCWLVGLYSGASRQEAPGEASMGREIHLFSWDGVDRIRVPLDAVLLGVAVDPLTGVIYGTRPHPLPGVLRIELPEDLASTLRHESAGC